MKINERQKKFADLYIETGNAEASAKEAGYSWRGNGSKLLQNTSILQYIAERNAQIESERIASMKEVKEFWTEIMRDNLTETKDRLKASEMIAKTNGAFIEKHDHSGEIGLNIDLSGLTESELKKLANLNE